MYSVGTHKLPRGYNLCVNWLTRNANTNLIAELAREARQRSTMGKKMKQSTHPRKFGNHVTVHRPTAHPRDRPFAPQMYQCKITQSTGMATQMQLEVILAGNRIATRVL